MTGFVTDPAVLTLLSALTRLEETIEAETAALEVRSVVDLQEINRLKSRSLLELTRAVRSVSQTVDPALSARVVQLKEKLARNQHRIAVHLSAVQEVTAIFDRVMREGESDGTYSAFGMAGEARP